MSDKVIVYQPRPVSTFTKKGVDVKKTAKVQVAVEKEKQKIRSQKKSKIPNSIFPWSKVLSMRYSYSGVLTTGATPTKNTIYQRVDAYSEPQVIDMFNLNSIARPRTGSLLYNQSDFRPQNYDQIKLIYGKYKVLGAVVTLLFHDVNKDGCVIVTKINSSDDQQLLGSLTLDVATMKKNVFPPLSISDTGEQRVIKRYYFTPMQIDGLTKGQFKNDINQYTANINSNPSSLPRIQFGIASTNTDEARCDYTIHIDYITRLYRRESLESSPIA